MSTTKTTTKSRQKRRACDEYDALLRSVAKAGESHEPLFTTDANGLWELYLGGFSDPDERQHHNCHACKDFIVKYGGLVTIDITGTKKSAFWDILAAPSAFRKSVAAMNVAVNKAKVTGVFLYSRETLGVPHTGKWKHFSVTLPLANLHAEKGQTAAQAMAERVCNFQSVVRALNEFSERTLSQAVVLLQNDALYRSEKVLGHAKWLLYLYRARAAAQGQDRANVVWRAIATAPHGFCHPRASMIGTLLGDIEEGKDMEEIARKFRDKMDPMQYQRPQAAPTKGAIDAAEKLMRDTGAYRSLERRFARVDEITKWHWKPKEVNPQSNPGGGVFDHLRGGAHGAERGLCLPRKDVSWAVFRRDILPVAESIMAVVPDPGPYCALTTAVHPDAPPILQWDSPDARNPVAWYFWHGGSRKANFNLAGVGLAKVVCIAPKPSAWGNCPCLNQSECVLFVLDGARELRNPGGGLFPESIRSEYHSARSVIEAYSRTATMSGLGEPHAAGMMLSARDMETLKLELRVMSRGNEFRYNLVMWE